MDDDFALVGGGIISFSDASTALGAFVTESRPLDNDQTWRGATAEDFWRHISVRAIGMKLDGVAPDLLKEAITRTNPRRRSATTAVPAPGALEIWLDWTRLLLH